jgi:hypothetical protein
MVIKASQRAFGCSSCEKIMGTRACAGWQNVNKRQSEFSWMGLPENGCVATREPGTERIEYDRIGV